MVKRCFKSHPTGFPPIKQPLALEAEATRFCVPPGKWGKKKEKIQVLSVNWNTLRRGSLADVSVIASMVLAGALADLAMREGDLSKRIAGRLKKL